MRDFVRLSSVTIALLDIDDSSFIFKTEPIPCRIHYSIKCHLSAEISYF
jgi:hypothetical protein